MEGVFKPHKIYFTSVRLSPRARMLKIRSVGGEGGRKNEAVEEFVTHQKHNADYDGPKSLKQTYRDFLHHSFALVMWVNDYRWLQGCFYKPRIKVIWGTIITEYHCCIFVLTMSGVNGVELYSYVNKLRTSQV